MRCPGDREGVERAAIVRGDRIEVGRLEQAAQSPARRHALAPELRKGAPDAGRIVAEHDRVADPGPPPLIRGRDAETHRTEIGGEGRLARIEARVMPRAK